MDVVVEYVCKLMGETIGAHKVEENDIGIVTPFKFQASVIKKALQKKGWYDISVGTVEIFQGQEKDIIIISTVRSVIFQHNGKFHIGFLSNDKVFLFLNLIINNKFVKSKFYSTMVARPGNQENR